MGTPRVIGVDFDNTLVIYDDVFQAIALQRGLIPDGRGWNKREIRDFARRLPEGEILWQKLQAAAYGPRIGEARLAEGALEFLALCRRAETKVYVISHKTEHAGYDETGTNLRQAALEWMTKQHLWETAGLGREAVHFAATRREKIDFIRNLGCTHFVDDLEETFLEPCFPGDVEKILYAPRPLAHAPRGVKVARSWIEIGEYLFAPER
jgi:hypothetical protein